MCSAPRIHARRERWPIRGAFRISRGSKTEAEVVVVEAHRAGVVGRGEAVPYARYGEEAARTVAAIERVPADVTREELARLLPAGAARNALDCALWDVEAKRAGRRAWEIAGTGEPGPVTTASTLSLDTPDAMARAAAEHRHAPLLKVKVGVDDPVACVEAVRGAAPDADLIVDANESWSVAQLVAIAPRLVELGVALVEQPVAAGDDGPLTDLELPVAVCADESCHTRADLPDVIARYDAVNVKLDKAGGLTEALALVRAARGAGLRVMLGCMVSTSLAVAPAMSMAALADVVDLDGPLLLARDRVPGLRYEGTTVYPPRPELWG